LFVLVRPLVLALVAGVLASLPLASASVALQRAVSISVPRASAPVGATVTIRGTVRAPAAGGFVRLQVRAGADWRPAGRDRLERGGDRFEVRVAARAKRYRVVLPPRASRAAQRSRVVVVAPARRPADPPAGEQPPAPEDPGEGRLPDLTPAVLADHQARMVAQINAYRADHGLSPLATTPELQAAAQGRARAIYEGRETTGDVIQALGHLPGQTRHAVVCEGRERTPADGPNEHLNEDYLGADTSVAVGYHYDETTGPARRPVWVVYVFTPFA
jgi:hypothetical protein